MPPSTRSARQREREDQGNARLAQLASWQNVESIHPCLWCTYDILSNLRANICNTLQRGDCQPCMAHGRRCEPIHDAVAANVSIFAKSLQDCRELAATIMNDRRLRDRLVAVGAVIPETNNSGIEEIHPPMNNSAHDEDNNNGSGIDSNSHNGSDSTAPASPGLVAQTTVDLAHLAQDPEFMDLTNLKNSTSPESKSDSHLAESEPHQEPEPSGPQGEPQPPDNAGGPEALKARADREERRRKLFSEEFRWSP